MCGTGGIYTENLQCLTLSHFFFFFVGCPSVRFQWDGYDDSPEAILQDRARFRLVHPYTTIL